MYRSPGTASSPDLATLLRKAKARGTTTNGSKGQELPSTPGRSDAYQGTTRKRSSTSSPAPSPQGTPAPKGKLKPNPFMDSSHDGTGSQEWVMTSPRSMGATKNAKSSVRQKTSAFLGKMLGQSSTRERSRTITSSPSTTSVASYPSTPLMDAFTPPVPPIPAKHRQNYASPRADPSDVFSDSSSLNKSLPSAPSDTDEHPLVMADDPPSRSRSPSPTTTLRQRPTSASNHTRTTSRGNKRRSMSVSDADIKKAMSAGARSSKPGRTSGEGRRPEVREKTLSGIISDFRGELSQFDSATPLDLHDPTTPARRPALAALRAQSDGVTENGSPVRSMLKPIPSSPVDPPTPTLTLQPAEATKPASAPVSPPMRTSSLQGAQHSPLRARSGSGNAGPPRISSLKYGPRSPQMRNGSGSLASVGVGAGMDRLRAQHRSTASTSEPSLVPASDLVGDGITRFALSNPGSAGTRGSPAKSLGEESADLDSRGRDLAEKCWTEDKDFLAKDKIAEWLGGQSPINKTALKHYMDHFDFSGLRLDYAFRRMCAKLFLKAETQQVDRILEEFARRYFDCNHSTILGSASVVHAVTYSLLLLNTDLHVAELTSRMSRGQFVRNTLMTIQMQLQPSHGSNSDLSYDDWTSFRAGSDSDVAGARRAKRSDSITSWNSIGTRDGTTNPVTSAATSSGQLSSASDGPGPASGSSLSVASGPDTKAYDRGSKALDREPAPAPVMRDRNWEVEMENLLKEMYNTVKNQQILQPIGSTLMARSSTSSLSPHHGPLLRQRSMRGQQGDRLANLKRGSIRGLQSILHAQAGVSPYSSNSSIEGRASPAPSFANSIDGLHAAAAFFTPAMGFASNLSNTIIRETQEDDMHSMKSEDSGTDASITDEELALLGPPWAKEGMLCRKQYWESAGRRARSKAWMDVFVVIQKGELSMFVFGEHAHGASNVVGGGNWLENAQAVGTLLLAHSLAHALPPPGYNRQRPHCMVLTLSNGGVYFFQAGTEELVNEWVSTCNYWAARQSKEPLIGGVSNMEYGWNRVVDPVTRVRSVSEDNFSLREENNEDGVSVKSGRSGRSRLRDIAATVRADKSPWADRTFINEWKPPMAPSVPSNHDEETQLEALQKHVAYLKTELKQHNELRTPMTNLYQPRSANAAKATSNWEKKSQYLLTEIVKYESYIDSLQAAMSLRLKKRGEKALERALVVASPTDDEGPSDTMKAKWKGQPDEETIEEGEEPPPSGRPPLSPSAVGMHRREQAETGDGGR